MSKHGYYENPKKVLTLEYYDSTWEYDYMRELEGDDAVTKWTKNHSIRIPYLDEDSKYKYYNPDFLIEKTDGTIELVEMKSKHLLKTLNTKRKAEYARKWCDARGIEYRLISRYQ